MNKTTFEVGKTYLTRDGRKVLIKKYAGTQIIGTTRWEDGDESTHIWDGTGNYFFSGQSPMDLMPTEPELEGKTARDLCDTVYGVYSRIASYVSDKQEQDSVQPKLKEENASLFKANLELLEEVDALQKENRRLHTQLHEARLIAQGMVDASKIFPSMKCSCGYFYLEEDKHMFPTTIGGIYGFKICRACGKLRDLHESKI